MTLQCASRIGFHRSILMKDGEGQPSWTLNSQAATRGVTQALFPVGPVTPSLRWTFRCYDYYSNIPQVWSDPSEPWSCWSQDSCPTHPPCRCSRNPRWPQQRM